MAEQKTITEEVQTPHGIVEQEKTPTPEDTSTHDETITCDDDCTQTVKKANTTRLAFNYTDDGTTNCDIPYIFLSSTVCNDCYDDISTHETVERTVHTDGKEVTYEVVICPRCEQEFLPENTHTVGRVEQKPCPKRHDMHPNIVHEFEMCLPCAKTIADHGIDLLVILGAFSILFFIGLGLIFHSPLAYLAALLLTPLTVIRGVY